MSLSQGMQGDVLDFTIWTWGRAFVLIQVVVGGVENLRPSSLERSSSEFKYHCNCRILFLTETFSLFFDSSSIKVGDIGFKVQEKYVKSCFNSVSIHSLSYKTFQSSL